MDDIDRENVKFLLEISPESFLSWCKEVDLDDLLYAHSLISVTIAECIDDVTDTTAANSYLKKFMKA